MSLCLFFHALSRFFTDYFLKFVKMFCILWHAVLPLIASAYSGSQWRCGALCNSTPLQSIWCFSASRRYSIINALAWICMCLSFTCLSQILLFCSVRTSYKEMFIWEFWIKTVPSNSLLTVFQCKQIPGYSLTIRAITLLITLNLFPVHFVLSVEIFDPQFYQLSRP